MSDTVEVPFGDNPGEQATLLLAAAEKLKDHDQAEVRTGSGVFIVPKDVADEAGVDYDEDDDSDDEPEAKKTAAKKTAPAKK